ncbi:hypothetical protein O2W15_23210 [Modestobacter sp. VKM Ac-2979]|uniref:hypothetical protein n=1 Tax=unclassified Modestobacter TaxID=2643866 RepID=UPI0022AB8C3E|nr:MULTISPECIES: hypothetical protein [unclassified Modestobacter]MCZ2814350.1 hypothetical protein [Modestobacter sp. VKM Ac-2979]MCZ2843958.1 hypothetical protein [Modestobacter sp. VKM Ac-2980]
MRKALLPWVVITLLVLVTVAVVLFSWAGDRIDARVELAKAVLTLITAVLVTGVLSVALSWHSARRAHFDERTRVLSGALQELKAGVERVHLTRSLLAADRSATNAKAQVAGLSTARSHLQEVERERHVRGTEVAGEVQVMLDYLRTLRDEIGAHYADLDLESLREQRHREAVVAGRADQLRPPAAFMKTDLPRLGEFIDLEVFNRSTFTDAYRRARTTLTDWLAEAERRSGP